MDNFLEWMSKNPEASSAIIGLVMNAIVKYLPWKDTDDLIQIILKGIKSKIVG